MKNIDSMIPNSIPATRAIFDNGGGVTLQLPGFSHYYSDPAHAARDFGVFLHDGHTGGWEGDESESAELEPSDDEIRNGGYKILYSSDISEMIAADEEIAWGNVMTFLHALESLAEEAPNTYRKP